MTIESPENPSQKVQERHAGAAYFTPQKVGPPVWGGRAIYREVDASLTADESDADSTDAAEAPKKSDDKPTWLAYRQSQGYSDEELDGLTKEKLIALSDK